MWLIAVIINSDFLMIKTNSSKKMISLQMNLKEYATTVDIK